MATEAGIESEQTTDTSTTDDSVTDDVTPEPEAAEAEQPKTRAKPVITEDGVTPEAGDDNAETETKAEGDGEKPQGLVVTLAEDVEEPPPPPDKAAKAFAALRKKARDAERERDELKAKLATPAVEVAPTLPPEPDLADDDVAFDKDRFKRKWAQWNAKKAEVDAHKAKAETEAAKRNEDWAKEQQRYQKSIEAIKAKVPNYGDAERFVASLLSDNQQVFLIESTEDTAKVVLALSQHPDKARDLAAIKSLPKFTKALVELEKSMTIKDSSSTKKPKAPPEKSISSGGTSATATNLEALEKEALRTGDMTKVFAEKRRLKQLQESRKK
jgi:hypothetical protein